MTARNTDNIVEFYRPLNDEDPTQHTYSVKEMKEAKVRRGIAWSSKILRDGNKIGEVYNDGDGGCNIYYFDNNTERDLFEETAKKAYEGDMQFEGEEEDIFVAWLDIQGTSYTAVKAI